MNLDRIIGHGCRSTHVGGQFLQLDINLSAAALAFSTVSAQTMAMASPNWNTFVSHRIGRSQPSPLFVGKGDKARDAVLALYVLVGHHLVDAGHLFGFGRVDGDDIGMGNLRLHKGKLQGIRREFEPQVRAVVAGSGHLGQSARTRIFSAPDHPVGRELVGQLLHRDFAAQDACSIHHRIHQGLVTRAAAGVPVALKPVTHVLACGLGILIQEGLRGDDEAGAAEAALSPAVYHPGHLDRMQVFRRADTFDSGDLRAFLDLFHLGDAGTDHFSVQDYRAGAALGHAAADLGARQAELSAKHVR